MRVLFVTYHYLHGYGGGVFASRGFINAAAELYDDVTLLCPVSKGRSPEHINPKVRIVGIEDTRSALKKGLDLAAGCPHRFAKAFPELLSGEKFDMIVFDTSYVCWGLIDLARSHSKDVVTIHHNWQYEYEKDNARGFLRPLRLRAILKCEKEALHKSTLNITLTEQDRQSLFREYDPEKTCRIVVCPPFEYE